MGRSSEDEGESSSTDQATLKDDEDERPLKKARYIWQIKGKYHLREKERKIFLPSETAGENISVPVEFQSISAVCCGDEESCDIGERTMESLPDDTSPGDKCPPKCPSPLQDIEDVIKEDDTPFVVPTEEKSSEVKHTAPPVHFILERESHSAPRTSSCCFQSFLHSVTHSSLHVRKWQTKQLAKGIVDNTINKVLEDMGFVPLPGDADDVFIEPINCNDSHQNFENEAVLMAIQSHGLQRNEFEPPSSQGKESLKECEPHNGSKSSTLKGLSSSGELLKETSTQSASLPQVVSDVRDFESCEPYRPRQPVDGFQPKFNLTRPKFNVNDPNDGEKWLEEMVQEIESSVMPLGFTSDRYGIVSSSSSDDNTDSVDSFVKLDYEDEGDDKLMVIGYEEKRPCGGRVNDPDSQPSVPLEKPIPLVEHDDFLDQAVAVAIQKKGLSVFGCIDNG